MTTNIVSTYTHHSASKAVLLGAICACVLAPGRPASATEHHFITGGKLAVTDTFVSGHSAVRMGSTVFGEFALIEHALDIELSIGFLPSNGVLSVPIDILAKYPLSITQHLQAYAGAGPTVEIATGEERGAEFGVAAAGGFYYWFNDSVGFNVEATYATLFARDISQELGGRTGFILDF